MKKNLKKNRLPLLALSALLAIGLIAGTLAAFNTTYEVDNIFKVGTANSQFIEEFDAPTTDIIYGQTFKKTGKVYNLGDTPVYAKAAISTTWTDWGTGTAGVLKEDAGVKTFAATLNFGATANITAKTLNNNVAVSTTGDITSAAWVYDATDNAFYYGAKANQTAIAGQATSDALLESVTFVDNALKSTSSDGKYYIASEWDTATAAPKAGATAHATQAEATAAAKLSTDVADANGKIYFVGQKAYEYPEYKGQLTVTITCEIQDTAF